MSLSGSDFSQSIEKPKSKRGGRRPGSGRKPNYLKRLGIEPTTAAKILAHANEPELWKGLLNHKNPLIRLKTLAYLTDRRDGKARQAVELTGGIAHAHTVYRDPALVALSAEELASLDSLTKKLALPAPDGPQNQIESKPAIGVLEATVEASRAAESG